MIDHNNKLNPSSDLKAMMFVRLNSNQLMKFPLSLLLLMTIWAINNET